MAGVSEQLYGQRHFDTSIIFFHKVLELLSPLVNGKVIIFFFITKSWPWESVTYYKTSTKFGVTHFDLWYNVCFVDHSWNYQHGIKHTCLPYFKGNTWDLQNHFPWAQPLWFLCFPVTATPFPIFHPHKAFKRPRLFLPVVSCPSLYIFKAEEAIRDLLWSLALAMERESRVWNA